MASAGRDAPPYWIGGGFRRENALCPRTQISLPPRVSKWMVLLTSLVPSGQWGSSPPLLAGLWREEGPLGPQTWGEGRRRVLAWREEGPAPGLQCPFPYPSPHLRGLLLLCLVSAFPRLRWKHPQVSQLPPPASEPVARRPEVWGASEGLSSLLLFPCLRSSPFSGPGEGTGCPET